MVNTSVVQLKDGPAAQGNEQGSFMVMFRAEASLRSASEPDEQDEKLDVLRFLHFNLEKNSIEIFVPPPQEFGQRLVWQPCTGYRGGVIYWAKGTVHALYQNLHSKKGEVVQTSKQVTQSLSFQNILHR